MGDSVGPDGHARRVHRAQLPAGERARAIEPARDDEELGAQPQPQQQGQRHREVGLVRVVEGDVDGARMRVHRPEDVLELFEADPESFLPGLEFTSGGADAVEAQGHPS